MTPSTLLFPISSDGGDSGSAYYAGYVLNVDDTLMHDINQAWDFLTHNPRLRSVVIGASGNPLPGSDFLGDGLCERDAERLERILDEIGEGGVRPVRKREASLINRCVVGRACGDAVVVSRYGAPQFRLYQKDDGEYFSSPGLAALRPDGMKRENEATSRRSRRLDRKWAAEKAAAAHD